MIWLLLFLFTVQMSFAFAYRYRKADTGTAGSLSYPPVSVLICGKNEADNFKRYLPLLLQQQYEHNDWEVVVVNDASEDDTAVVLAEFRSQFPKLTIISVPAAAERDLPGKKFALSKGLEACRHEVVLLTDADCYPRSANWLSSMAGIYAHKRSSFLAPGLFVLGYGSYQEEPGLLNRFVRWETRHTFMQYASWAMMGRPYMGVGRNLMYERTPVLQLLQDDTFAELFARTASGDDDLIVSALANVQNTVVADAADTHTVSIAPPDWKRWWRQKTRHVSSGKYYPQLIRNGLGLYAVSTFLFWILATILLVSYDGIYQILVLILVLLRGIIFWANSFRWSKALAEGRSAWFYPVGEWMWSCYNFAITPFIFWKNKRQWK